MLEELELARTFGGLLVSLIFMFVFSKYVTGLAFEQVKINNERMFSFLDDTLKKNTITMNELVLTLKDHVRSKDELIKEFREYTHHEGD